jgi:hypothetical protein
MAPIPILKAHLSHCLSAASTSGSASSWELSYQSQNFPEEATRHRNLGHLERDIAPVASDRGQKARFFAQPRQALPPQAAGN